MFKMVKAELVFLLIGLGIFSTITGKPLRLTGGDCNTEEGKEHWTVVDGGSGSFLGYGSDFQVSTHSITWSIDTDQGARSLLLATCYGPGNCTANSDYASWMYVQQPDGIYAGSRLQLNYIPSAFSGSLKVTESLSSGSVHTAACRIHVVRALMTATIDTLEYSSVSAYCNHPTTQGYNVSMSLKTESRLMDLGFCANSSYCHTTSLANQSQVTLSRLSSYTTVTMSNVTRDLAGTLTCVVTSVTDRATSSSSSQLNVYALGEVDNCTSEFQPETWSVVVICDVDGFYASSGTYDASLYVYTTTLARQSVKQYLTSHNDSTGRQFYRGRIQYTWALSSEGVEYAYIQPRIVLRASLFEQTAPPILHRILVSKPSSVQHNCTDLSYVPDDGSAPCVCTIDSMGSPRGRLRWLLGDVVIATGDYGVKELAFPSDKVSRRHEGLVVSCHLDWIDPQNLFLGRFVAYGPDAVNLNLTSGYDVNGNVVVIAVCHVTGMNPVTSDAVHWGGACVGRQGFVCTLTSGAEHDGKDVTCAVTNKYNNERSVSARATISLPARDGKNAQTDGWGVMNNRLTPAIPLGAALTFFVVLSIVLAVTLIILWQRGKNVTLSDAPKPKNEEDIQGITWNSKH